MLTNGPYTCAHKFATDYILAWRCWHYYSERHKKINMQHTIKNHQYLVEEHIGVKENNPQQGILMLEDGTTFEGTSFGYAQETAGEVVFGTGMVGYPEAITDASFAGQILVMTYPIIGNYGVPDAAFWEDDHIHVAGLVVSNYVDIPSHAQSTMNLGAWLRKERVPALEIKDTRQLTQHIRTHGTMLGRFVFDKEVPFYDPNNDNLVSCVSTRQVQQEGEGDTTIVLIDCGAKRNIARSLLARNVRVITVPWDWNPFTASVGMDFDGIVVSNGPGNPKMAQKTI